MRHPSKVIERALTYARDNCWTVVKSTGGSAHAWGVMRCPGVCPQVAIFSTPRVPENHARAPPAGRGSLPPRGRMTMPEYHFELTILGRLDEACLDALFEVGCDDATFSTKGELIVADVDRQAATVLEAIISAIRDVESVDDLVVLRVDPDELVWASEIAERTGRSRQSINQLIKGQRGPGGFPAPATHATRNPLWRWSDVEAWFAAYDSREPDTERSSVIGAINGALEARRSIRAAQEGASLREALQGLLAS